MLLKTLLRAPVALLLASTLAQAAPAATDFAQCRQFFVDNTPPRVSQASPGVQRSLCFSNFAVLHSGQSKTPVYVVERLNRGQLLDARDEQRTDKFYEEARLPAAERARLDDYRGSGYDRGHMSPAADQPSPEAMAQSFSLANMVPQAPVNNRKSWAGIEKATRKYVMRTEGDVYVYSGPVFQGQVSTIGADQVWVPAYLYKLVYDPNTNRAWAHWIANTDEARAERPISYQELVRRTGIEFLPGRHPLN